MMTPTADHCVNGSTYKHGCRCRYCKDRVNEWSRISRMRTSQQSFGVESPKDLMDAGPVIAAVQEAHGLHRIPIIEIAQATGVNKATVQDIFRGEKKRTFRRTHDAIMSKYGPDVELVRFITGQRRVDADDHLWKTRALLAQGWTWKHLEGMLAADGRPSGWIRPNHRDLQIHARNVEHLDWLVSHVGDRHGPSTVNKMRMLKRDIYPIIHYREDGKLLRKSIPQEQKDLREELLSNHGAASSSGDRSAA